MPEVGRISRPEMKVLVTELRQGYECRYVEFSVRGSEGEAERIKAYLLVPEGASKNRKCPAVLMLHDHGARFDIGKEKLVRPIDKVLPEGADDHIHHSSKQWADKQSQLQKEQTDFTIEQIEQQKEQAQKDYTKEQAGAYVDWQKQSNQYGVNAEKMASAGLAGSGFSESSQVSMYTAYQNRVATARESYNQAVLNYNNAIKDARLQNNAALAEIAYNALQQQLELSLQGFQYKNQLISELSDKKMQVESLYNDKWKTQLDVMNKEVDRTWQADQNEIERQWKEKEAQLDRDFQSAQAEIERKFKEAQAELDRQHDFAVIKANTQAEKERADYEHKLAMQKLAKQQEYELAQMQKEYENEKSLIAYQNSLKSSSSGGGGSGDKGTKFTTEFFKEDGNESNLTTQQSILNLGYGPISASRLNELVASGVVEEYTQNGEKLFRKKTGNNNAKNSTNALSGFAKFLGR